MAEVSEAKEEGRPEIPAQAGVGKRIRSRRQSWHSLSLSDLDRSLSSLGSSIRTLTKLKSQWDDPGSARWVEICVVYFRCVY